MSDPEAVFSELRGLTPQKAGRAYRVFDGPTGLDLRIFVDGESRLPGISFNVPKKMALDGWDLPDIRGMEFMNVQGNRSSNQHLTYELLASEPAFANVFVELAARLIVEASAQTSTESALIAIGRRLVTWSRFFNIRGREALSRTAQLGLIGELLCILRLAPLIGLHESIEAWTGPYGTVHDFQNHHAAIEVKLTTSASPERFRITSERQLDESVVPWLGLFAVRAQEVTAGNRGLPELVDFIRLEIDSRVPVAATYFEERLLQAGYVDTDRNDYQIRISVRGEDFLRVVDDFPRILPAEVKSGVFDVAYDIAWSAIAPYRVGDDTVKEEMSGAGR